MAPSNRFALFLIWSVCALLLCASALYGQNTPRPGIMISDLNGAVGIHYVADKNILFLMPSLPDTFQVCTGVTTGGGYTNCRTMQALRFPVK